MKAKNNKNKPNVMKCEQTNCSFYKVGCKSCASCGVEPNKVTENCEKCFKCEFQEGELRWEDERLKPIIEERNERLKVMDKFFNELKKMRITN